MYYLLYIDLSTMQFGLNPVSKIRGRVCIYRGRDARY